MVPTKAWRKKPAALSPLRKWVRFSRVVPMTRFLAVVCLLSAAGCMPAGRSSPKPANQDLWLRGFPDLPRDARHVVERLAACSHFAGEFNGDQSQRDKDVSAAEARLHCDAIDREAAAIRKRYAGNKAVQDALVAASRF